MQTNPYHATLTDEASGIEVEDNRFPVWNEGHQAGINNTVERLQMIKDSSENAESFLRAVKVAFFLKERR